MTKNTNIAVIIRQSGERTIDLCKRFVEDQVDSRNIMVINEVPFSKAVRRTFEIGLDFKFPWTLAIDADVLIQENAVRAMISKAECELENTFSFNFRVHDKFFTSPRYGGPHLYRTNIFHKALKYFPSEETIRPESIIGEILHEKEGIENILYDRVVGIHDYEQWYRDVYRKAFVHANKHGNNYVQSFLKYWSRMMDRDLDYRVALVGLCHGIAFHKKVEIDIRKLPIDYSENDLLKDLEEKKPLDLYDYSPEEDIYKYVDSITYSSTHPRLSELGTFTKNAQPLRIVPGLIFYSINKVSGRIYKWANTPAKKKSRSQ